MFKPRNVVPGQGIALGYRNLSREFKGRSWLAAPSGGPSYVEDLHSYAPQRPDLSHFEVHGELTLILRQVKLLRDGIRFPFPFACSFQGTSFCISLGKLSGMKSIWLISWRW